MIAYVRYKVNQNMCVIHIAQFSTLICALFWLLCGLYMCVISYIMNTTKQIKKRLRRPSQQPHQSKKGGKYMNYIETVGNIRVYADINLDKSITVQFFNGSDLVAKEVYFNTRLENAIADLFSKKLDTYTEEWLWLNCLTDGLVKISENTYKTSETDWFCRIDDTIYFMHFSKKENEFIRDKDGNRIIDR